MFIDKAGIYTGEIIKAYDYKSKNGAMFFCFTFLCQKGELKVRICFLSNKNRPTKFLQHLKNLLVILNLKEFSPNYENILHRALSIAVRKEYYENKNGTYFNFFLLDFLSSDLKTAFEIIENKRANLYRYLDFTPKITIFKDGVYTKENYQKQNITELRNDRYYQ